MRVVFMGSPDFALPCLEQLLQSPYEVVGVVTQPDRPKGRGKKLQFTPVKERALSKGIPVFQPENVNHPDSVEKLRSLAPDVLVVVAFGQILKKELLALPPLGCINVHASLLPKYRGAAPIHWAIINGETETGVTTMFMDEGMDTGDMILKKTIPIGAEDTTGMIHDRLADTGGKLLRETLDLLQHHQAPRKAQDHRLATYAPLLTREHERIDWTKNCREVYNLVRGMNPWPGAYTTFENKIVKIWETKIIAEESEGRKERPGTVLEAVHGKGIKVKCGQGSLWITVLQPQGKQAMAGDAWARGARLQKGSALE
ncbi:MAG: methionyl-tRNA formyltransferase [Bacillota bacterium]|jgi:methionyl-tRNA formyltransferase|nr:methionyl-tRNA formyltransferase [Clostridia bacterium]